MVELYGAVTKVLNQTVKRNIERYPEDVLFQLDRKDVFFLKSQQITVNEHNVDLRSQIVTSSLHYIHSQILVVISKRIHLF